MEQCDVREATHVMVGTTLLKIESKWGIDSEGRLAPPSKGGFGVITENGRHVGMFDAMAYYKEDAAK